MHHETFPGDTLRARCRRAEGLLAVALLSVALGASQANAALLNLSDYKHPPDITSGDTQVTYASNAFSAIGTAFTMDFNGSPPPDDYNMTGAFQLNMVLTNGGGLTSGTFVVTGHAIPTGLAPAIPDTAAPFLSGTVVAFGYQASAPFQLFEAEVANLTGDGASLFAPKLGIILNANSWLAGQAFTGSFASGFKNNGTGTSDTFPVPEPTSGALALLGLAMGAVLRRHRVKRRAPATDPIPATTILP